MSDANMLKRVKHPKEVSYPQDEDDNDEPVQDRFDLRLHRNKSVDEPQHKPNSNDCDDDGSKRHILFSVRFASTVRALAIVGKFNQSTHLARQSSERGE